MWRPLLLLFAVTAAQESGGELKWDAIVEWFEEYCAPHGGVLHPSLRMREVEGGAARPPRFRYGLYAVEDFPPDTVLARIPRRCTFSAFDARMAVRRRGVDGFELCSDRPDAYASKHQDVSLCSEMEMAAEVVMGAHDELAGDGIDAFHAYWRAAVDPVERDAARFAPAWSEDDLDALPLGARKYAADVRESLRRGWEKIEENFPALAEAASFDDFRLAALVLRSRASRPDIFDADDEEDEVGDRFAHVPIIDLFNLAPIRMITSANPDGYDGDYFGEDADYEIQNNCDWVFSKDWHNDDPFGGHVEVLTGWRDYVAGDELVRDLEMDSFDNNYVEYGVTLDVAGVCSRATGPAACCDELATDDYDRHDKLRLPGPSDAGESRRVGLVAAAKHFGDKFMWLVLMEAGTVIVERGYDKPPRPKAEDEWRAGAEIAAAVERKLLGYRDGWAVTRAAAEERAGTPGRDGDAARLWLGYHDVMDGLLEVVRGSGRDVAEDLADAPPPPGSGWLDEVHKIIHFSDDAVVDDDYLSDDADAAAPPWRRIKLGEDDDDRGAELR